MAGSYEVLYARMALTLGVADRERLRVALAAHGKQGWGTPFPRYLVEQKVLSEKDAARVAQELDRWIEKRREEKAAAEPAPPPPPPEPARSPSKRLKPPETKASDVGAKAPPSSDPDRAKQWALYERATKDPLEKLVGRKLGRSQIDKLVETGDVATVFAGRFGDEEQPVRVKVLRPDRVRDKVALERFTREAQVLAKITHPNIGRVVEAGVAEAFKVQVAGQQVPVRYMTIESSAGSSLATMLTRSGPLAPDRIARIGRATALGLAAAHRAGVIHRDLRPANILVSDDGSVKITGFGLAKDNAVPGRLTATGQITGNPTWTAPEVALGKTVDGRADVYSLGCVLYTSLAGRPPFTSPSIVKLIGLHLNTAAPRLSEVAPHVGPRLADLVHRFLAKSPADRPDADEAARLLGAKDLCEGGAEPPKPLKADSEEELRRALSIEESSGNEEASPALGPVCSACEMPLDGPPAATVHDSPLCMRCLEKVESLDVCASCFSDLDEKQRGSKASAVFAGHVYCPGCTERLTLPCGQCGGEVALAGLLDGKARAAGEKLVHAACPSKKR